MPKNESLINKNTYFYFKGPKGSVILEAMNLIKLGQECESRALEFPSQHSHYPSCPGGSKSLRFFVHKKIGIIKAYVKKIFFQTVLKLKVVTEAHNFNNSLDNTIISSPANYG